MASAFRKLAKRLTPNPAKLTPQHVKKNETLSKLQNINIVNRAAAQNHSIVSMPDWGDTKAMRGNIREQHELGTTPFSNTSDKIRARNKLPGGAERDKLTGEISAKTLRRGSIGIAIGGAAVGASSLGGAAASAAQQTGMRMIPYENTQVLDPSELYIGAPGRRSAGTVKGSNSGLWVMGGLLLLKVLL